MATPERPKSRLPDGSVNPAYTAWRKEYILKPKDESPTPAAVAELLKLRVIGPARNANFMLCDHDGEKVPVRVDKRNAKRVLGKSIPVRIESDGTYQHAP